jgi:23S rRNA (cytidine1920-2'-O)/16S rRNA (cytidine1409-2'-O)-methyltransferase
MVVKQRLDIVVAERGLAESRSKALAMILAGSIEVNGVVVTKAGTPVADDVVITLKESNPYVSRGGLKLASALRIFPLSPEHKTCMDIGSSTGGFTDYLLQHGAVKVYAVDVGHGQLHWKLRNDTRVVVMEGVNFRYFNPGLLKDPVEFVTIDVSFISLDKILPTLARCLASGGQVLAMVKPQFEMSAVEVKRGVVRDEQLRATAINRIRDVAVDCGFVIAGGVDSEVKGPKGNIEHFLWLRYESPGC